MDTNTGYSIFMTIPDIGIVTIPVNPQEVTITYPSNPSNYDVEGLGEVIVPRKVKLRTFSIESFFPREGIYQPVAVSNSWARPEWYVSLFRALQVKGTPFEITFCRGADYLQSNGNVDLQHYDSVVMNAVVLDFSTTDKGGEPGDIYYNVSFSEYRDASPQTLAEVSKQTFDDEGRIESQELVVVKTRTPEPNVITAGSTVTVNGNVYDNDSETDDEWMSTNVSASNVVAVVTRVLPPAMGKNLHGIFIDGLGWVDEASCALNGNKNDYDMISKVNNADV